MKYWDNCGIAIRASLKVDYSCTPKIDYLNINSRSIIWILTQMHFSNDVPLPRQLICDLKVVPLSVAIGASYNRSCMYVVHHGGNFARYISQFMGTVCMPDLLRWFNMCVWFIDIRGKYNGPTSTLRALPVCLRQGPRHWIEVHPTFPHQLRERVLLPYLHFRNRVGRLIISRLPCEASEPPFSHDSLREAIYICSRLSVVLLSFATTLNTVLESTYK